MNEISKYFDSRLEESNPIQVLSDDTVHGATRANPFVLTRPCKLRVSVITTAVLHG